jgi:hypothetical protein
LRLKKKFLKFLKNFNDRDLTPTKRSKLRPKNIAKILSPIAEEDSFVESPCIYEDKKRTKLMKQNVNIKRQRFNKKVVSFVDTKTHEKNSKAQPKNLFKQFDVMENEKGNIRLSQNTKFPHDKAIDNGLFKNSKYYLSNPNENINFIVATVPSNDKKNLKVQYRDYLSLSPQQWLTGDIIDAIFSMKIKKNLDKNLIFINHKFTRDILSGNGLEKVDQESFSPIKYQYKPNSILIMPFVEQSHWVLVLAYMEKQEIQILNSIPENQTKEGLQHTTDKTDKILNNFKIFINLIQQKSDDWHFVKKNCIAYQEDSYNCGIFVIMYFDSYFGRKNKRQLKDFDADACRTMYADEILENSVQMKNACLLCGFDSPKIVNNMIMCSSCRRWICYDTCIASHYDTRSNNIENIEEIVFECFLCEENNFKNNIISKM